MAQMRYYTPRLDRDLVTLLYHAAKARHMPMTRLASELIRGALAHTEARGLREDGLAEEPSPPDPGRRTV